MKRTTPNNRASRARRGGAVIVVVLALLASLAFIGLFFYSLSDSELNVARKFAESPDQVIDPDAVHNFALEQYLVSTKQQFAQSALSGGTLAGTPVSDKSILAHVLGLMRADGVPEDVRPRNGRGIGVYGSVPDANGMPSAPTAADIHFDFDGNYDGTLPTAERTGTDFRMNLSSVANNGAPNYGTPFERSGSEYQNTRPDVDYTYPDINSPFLAHESTIEIGGTPYKIVIPSYLRPQLFPGKRSGGAGFSDLYSDVNTAAQVLRPHQQHFNSDGTTRRFLTAAGTPAQSGDRNRIIGPFPFSVGNNEDTNGNGFLDPNEDDGPGGAAPVDDGDGVLDRPNDMGVFSGLSNAYQLDVDADGDGTLDSIWMDLDHPLVELADGRQAVPMFYFKAVDLDALINVNHHGHAPYFARQSYTAPGADPFTDVYGLTAGWIHASNLGMSPAEINPLPSLSADLTNPSFMDPAYVAEATLQHRGFYSDQTSGPADRTTGFTRVQLANTELLKMLIGSPQYRQDLNYANPNPASDIPGRYGESFALRPALSTAGPGTFPGAGNSSTDDDGDDNESIEVLNGPSNNDGPTAPDDNLASGIAHYDDFGGQMPAPGLLMPPAVHPLDFSGLGNWPAFSTLLPGRGVSYSMGPAGGERDLAGSRDPAEITNPSAWLLYGVLNIASAAGRDPALWSMQDRYPIGTFPVNGIFPWFVGASNNRDLQFSEWGSEDYDGLFNENDEITSDPNFPTQYDEPYPTSEAAFLQMSDQQWALIHEDSRLRKLANVNFEANRQAAAIRQRFTPDSRDRLEHGYSRPLNTDRQWEFNDTYATSGQPRFPPAFDTASSFGGPFTSQHEGATPLNPPASVPIIDTADPFRPVVRRLLTVEESNTSNIGSTRGLPGQRLNLNRLLVNFDRYGNPIYKHLTPHATFQLGDNDNGSGGLPYLFVSGTGEVRPLHHRNVTYTQSYYDEGTALNLLDPDIPAPTSGSFADVPFSAASTDRFAQEAWARYDRQRLARDIYVLLYTLGAPDDDGAGTPFDPTITPYPPGADTNGNGISDFVDAAAQFAVNYVDALDHDDVITRFEYDPDLTNGWDDSGALWPASAVAYGVEAQQVTFSEVLLVQQAPTATDNAATLHNEADGSDFEHRWLYMELRNATPFPVPLTTGSYRIARYLQNEAGRTGPTTPIAASEFRTPTSGPARQINPGHNFIVACHDGFVQNPAGAATSDFYSNYEDSTPGFEATIPAGGLAVANPSDDPVSMANAPNADLDLNVTTTMVPGYDELYANTIPAPGGTSLVEPQLSGTGAPVQFQLRLERRMNPHGFGFGEDTWVEVDRIEVEGKTFLANGETASDIQTALANVASRERQQPLDEVFADNADVTYYYRHSLNSVAPLKHTGNWAWASVNGGEPFPAATSFKLWQPHFNRDFSSIYELLSVPIVGPDRLVRDLADEANNRMSGWVDSTAALRAPFVAGGVFQYPDGDTNLNNTLDAGETPNRWYRLFEFVEIPPRTHDTVRDGQSIRRRTDGKLQLNTLRHETVMAGVVDDMIQLNTLAARPAIDRFNGAARNWFDQLLFARDGVDPFTNLPLPGLPGSLPFRSMSYINPQAAALVSQSTLLRKHRPATGPLDYLPLFEARSSADISNDNLTNNDADNVDYHTRNRLLAKIANNTTNRSHVFAIWVGYELFEAHQPSLPNTDIVQIGARIEDLPGHREFVVADMTRLEEAYLDDPNTADAGRFDFRKFIIYRKRIK